MGFGELGLPLSSIVGLGTTHSGESLGAASLFIAALAALPSVPAGIAVGVFVDPRAVSLVASLNEE
jgi:hypothetical protein